MDEYGEFTVTQITRFAARKIFTVYQWDGDEEHCKQSEDTEGNEAKNARQTRLTY